MNIKPYKMNFARLSIVPGSLFHSICTKLGTLGLILICDLILKSSNLVHSYKKRISSPITALSKILQSLISRNIKLSSVINRYVPILNLNNALS